MTTRQMFDVLNKQVYVRMDGLEIPCVVVDAKQAYGKARLLITPICGGRGEIWVETSRITAIVDGSADLTAAVVGR